MPKELRKDFFALSGLFYVADTHFEMFYAARQKSKITAQDNVFATPTLGQELNFDTVTAYFAKRYPNRPHSTLHISELVSQLIATGYTTLDRLHIALEASADAFAQYEATSIKKKKTKFADVGLVRISLGILDPAFAEIMKYDDTITKYRKFVRAR